MNKLDTLDKIHPDLISAFLTTGKCDGIGYSHLRFRNVLGSAGLVFVRRIFPNLELGAGLALNNAFGYPMALPALYRSASVSLRKWVGRWL